jgi:hypothetical protein
VSSGPPEVLDGARGQIHVRSPRQHQRRSCIPEGVASKCGIGFELPSFVPSVPKTEGNYEAQKQLKLLIVNEKHWSSLVEDFRTFLLSPKALGAQEDAQAGYSFGAQCPDSHHPPGAKKSSSSTRLKEGVGLESTV